MGFFRLSPSFFSFMAGVFSSLGINRLTALLDLPEIGWTAQTGFRLLAVFGLALTAAAMISISLKLEQLRGKSEADQRDARRYLLSWSFVAAGSFLSVCIFLYAAHP